MRNIWFSLLLNLFWFLKVCSIKHTRNLFLLSPLYIGELFADIQDATVLALSRISAFTLMSLRFLGDYFVLKAAGPGVMIQFLTGQKVKT